MLRHFWRNFLLAIAALPHLFNSTTSCSVFEAWSGFQKWKKKLRKRVQRVFILVAARSVFIYVRVSNKERKFVRMESTVGEGDRSEVGCRWTWSKCAVGAVSTERFICQVQGKHCPASRLFVQLCAFAVLRVESFSGKRKRCVWRMRERAPSLFPLLDFFPSIWLNAAFVRVDLRTRALARLPGRSYGRSGEFEPVTGSRNRWWGWVLEIFDEGMRLWEEVEFRWRNCEIEQSWVRVVNPAIG